MSSQSTCRLPQATIWPCRASSTITAKSRMFSNRYWGPRGSIRFWEAKSFTRPSSACTSEMSALRIGNPLSSCPFSSSG